MPPKRARTTARQPAPQTSRAARTRKTAMPPEANSTSEEDVTNGLVRKSTKRTTRRRPAQDAYVSGGLGSPDQPRSKPSQTTRALARDEFEVPTESQDDNTKTAAARNVRARPARTVQRTQTAAHKATMEGLKARMAADEKASPAKEAPPRQTKPSNTSRRRSSMRDTVPAQASPKLATKAAPQSAQRQQQSLISKIQSTPFAGDSSVLALAQFRRRPRQPSLLHALANPDPEESSLTLDSTALSGDVDTTTTSIPFAPHDEGTPVVRSHLADTSAALAAQQAAAAIADDDELYTVSPRRSPKRGIKRKSDFISADAPSPSHAETTSAALAQPVPDSARGSAATGAEAEVEVPASQYPVQSTHAKRSRATNSGTSPLSAPPPSSPLAPHSASSAGSSTPRHPDDEDDSIFADPLSSSPPPASVASVSPAKPAGAGRRVPGVGQGRAAPALTSAMLRQMLPKRKVRREVYDVSFEESDSEAGSVDGVVGGRKATGGRRGGGRKVLGEVKGRKNARVTAGGGGGGTARSGGKVKKGKGGVVVVRAEEKENAEARRRTYSRRRREEEGDSEDGDGDGDGDGQGDGGVVQGGLSKELLAARDKFRRIDDAELEFESASLTGGSSPWR